MVIQTNDHSAEGRWSIFPIGSGINTRDEGSIAAQTDDHPTFTVPKIASSWSELQSLLQATGARAEGCVAALRK
jgi:hypothetical protein